MSSPRNVLSRKAAIAGIGATEFSKASGRSELQLSVEAVQHALADCGLTADDVDGLTTFTMDTSSEIAVARELLLAPDAIAAIVLEVAVGLGGVAAEAVDRRDLEHGAQPSGRAAHLAFADELGALGHVGDGEQHAQRT